MKRGSKRVVLCSIVLLLSVSMGLFAGGAAEKQPETSDGPVEVVFWGDWGGEGQKQFEYMVDAFNASQDEIVVKYVLTQDMITKFLTATASDQVPDIMFWDRWRTALYAPKGVLEPIDGYLQKDDVDINDFYSEAVRELSNGGKTYGLPLTVDTRALFYNKKMLEEKGLEPPTTWEELRAAAKELTVWNGDKLEVAGFSLSDVGLFNMWLQQAGGQMVTEDGLNSTFNNEKGLAVLDYWSLLMEDGVYQLGFESGLGDGVDAFATGKVAMTYSGPWMLSTYNTYGKDLEYGIAPPPAGPNGDKGALLGGFGLVIPSKAKNKDAAWEFMKWWLAVPENAAEYCKMSLNIPGTISATADAFYAEDDLYTPFIETFEFAKIRPPFPQYANMETKAVIPQLQLFMEGKIDAEEALSKAQQMADKILKE